MSLGAGYCDATVAGGHDAAYAVERDLQADGSPQALDPAKSTDIRAYRYPKSVARADAASTESLKFNFTR